MSHRCSVPQLFTAAMLFIAGVSPVSGTLLQAQEATMSPAVEQTGAVPASAEPTSVAATAQTRVIRTDAGPRIVPPFERYQPSLPGARDQSGELGRGGRGTAYDSRLDPGTGARRDHSGAAGGGLMSSATPRSHRTADG
jgi:hypothetical protein